MALVYHEIKSVKEVKVHGRQPLPARAEKQDFIPLLFNGAAVEFITDSSEVWLTVETNSGFHEPWVAYEINGAVMGRQMLLPGVHEICIFRSMSAGVQKRVKFYRELQAMGEDADCRILVKGIKADGAFFPVPEAKAKIEFIGDSITSGEGTYGASDDWDWIPMYMSFSRNYANIISRKLNADVRMFSQGGWGVYCGWDNDVRHNIPAVYENVCTLSTGEYNANVLGTQDPYDFSVWQPDVVVINLGTNDRSAFNQPPFTDPVTGETNKQEYESDGSFKPEHIGKVEKAVKDFLKTLRTHYPKAHLVWVYGMLGYDITMFIADAVREYSRETGDSNVAFINLPNTLGDKYGSHMHPGYPSHEQAAEVLAAYLAEKLNIENKTLGGNF